MALAQGLSSNLIEIAWKSHLHKLHPSPAAYSVRRGSLLGCLIRVDKLNIALLLAYG